jgi:hypothetical protein
MRDARSCRFLIEILLEAREDLSDLLESADAPS